MKNLLQKLVRAESTLEKGELACARIIGAEFEALGAQVQLDCWDKNRADVVVRVESIQERGALLFGCHLDVVPPGEVEWAKPPFSGTESDGKIWGRGSADMKGGLVAAVTAIRRIVESSVQLKGDIILVGAAGEETDSCGAKRFVSDFEGKDKGFCGIILPEPTDFEVVTAHRGMLWLEVSTQGKTAHGSTPKLGVNAISSMRRLLDELENYRFSCEPHDLLGDCSMSINTIEGGKAINVVPDRCTSRIDIRTLPQQSHEEIIEDFRAIFSKLKGADPDFEAQVSVVRSVEALLSDNECDFVRDFCSVAEADEPLAVGFTTDGPHFVPLGAPVVIFGPGKSNLCHKPDEYIDIADVERGADYFEKVILKFLT